MSTAQFYAVDWGTTNFRAFAVGPDGLVVDRMADQAGLLTIRDGAFEAQLLGALGPWFDRHGRRPVVMAGMVGAKTGWLEAPYAACPADRAALAGGMLVVPNAAGIDIRIVPGLACRDGGTGGAPDVMRGEETLILGLLQKNPAYEGPVLLPGTHSKCAVVAQGQIRRFCTAMTGEVYRLLLAHGILGQSATPFRGPPDAAFDDGLRQGLDGKGLLQALFAARTRSLLDGLCAVAAGAYLSGLLIGHELAFLKDQLRGQNRPVPVIGEPGLAALYGRGLALIDVAADTLDPETALIDGLLSLTGQAAGKGE